MVRKLRPREYNIISIDASLRSLGVVTLIQGKINSYAIQRKGERIYILAYYLKHFFKKIKQTEWDLCIIENYSFGSHSRSVTTQAEIGGVIRAVFSGYNVPILEISIQTWKSIAEIREPKTTTKQKSDYLNLVNEKFNVRFRTTDEADAYMMLWSVIQSSRGKNRKTGAIKIKQQLEDLGIYL